MPFHKPSVSFKKQKCSLTADTYTVTQAGSAAFKAGGPAYIEHPVDLIFRVIPLNGKGREPPARLKLRFYCDINLIFHNIPYLAKRAFQF